MKRNGFKLIFIFSIFASIGFGQANVTINEAQDSGIAVAAGARHACALSKFGGVHCWGASSTPSRLDPSVQIALGSDHICSLSEEGVVTCWGDNEYLQTAAPPNLAKSKQIAAGNHHSCALSEKGIVSCWGKNDLKQTAVPKNLPRTKNIVIRDERTCAVTEEGSVFCWGWGGMTDQKGNPEFWIDRVPESLLKAKEIVLGGRHACILSDDGKVECWGWNVLQTSVSPDLPKAKQIILGALHTCALSQEGSVSCWGHGERGQTKVPLSLNKTRQIESSYYHTCALSEEGDVDCWGENDKGQTAVPPQLKKTKRIFLGEGYTCAVSIKEEELTCWGSKHHGITTIPKEIEDLSQGPEIVFRLESLEKDLKKLSTRLYSYKSNYIKGLSTLTSQFILDPSKPLAAGYRAYATRYFILEMLEPLLETTETPFIKKKAIKNLRTSLNESKKLLTLENVHEADLTASIFKTSITVCRLAMQNSVSFLVDENSQKLAQNFFSDLGALETQIKLQGNLVAQSKELFSLLEKNQKLIEIITTEPRTAGFGATLEKIRQYLKGKI